jgi:predicted MFS family arabinose efflux permease
MQPSKNHKSAIVNPLGFIGRVDWGNLWDVFLVRFLLGCAVLVSRNNFTMLLEYKYDASPSTVGYVISYGSVVSTLGGWFVGSIAQFYQDDVRLLTHAAVAQTIGLFAVALAPSLAVLVLCTTPLSISSAVARVCSTNITITRATGAEIGALLGLGASVMSIGRMLAPFIGGLAQEVSVSGSTYLGAALAAAATLVLLLSPVHKVKES